MTDSKYPVNGELADAGDFGQGARVYNSAAISATDSAWTTLTFNTERWDTDSCHSTSVNTSRLTATSAGKYVICGSATFAPNATGIRQIAIILNGTTYIAIHGTASMGAVPTTPLTISAIYSLAATDYVELIVYQNSGGALNVNAGVNYSPEFAMIKVG